MSEPKHPHDDDLADLIAAGVEVALRRVISDPEVRRQFWAAGYEELETHASRNATQWIGRRILTWIIMGAVGAGIAWLVRSGAIK
jgi:hypothetical protein